VKVSAQTVEGSRVELSIEAEPQEMEQAIERSYQELANRATIPGFRKGKAPRAVLERYMSRGAIVQRAVDSLLPELYDKALKDRDIRPLGNPEVEISKLEPITFKAVVPVWPKVELSDYSALRLQPELVAVPEEQVEAALQQIRRQTAPWEPVERPATWGDLLILDVRGRSNGREVMKDAGAEFRLVEGWPFPVPGFAEKLVGMERGQSQEFSLSFAADHSNSSIAGKEFSFRVKVNEVKEQRLPDLNDDFAKGVGPGFDTLEALRQNITENMRRQAEAEARSKLAGHALDKVVEETPLDLPAPLLESEVDKILEEKQRSGGMETQLQAIGRSSEDVRNEVRPLARERLVRSLVLTEIAVQEGLVATSEEIDADIQAWTQAQGVADPRTVSALQSEEFRNSVARSIVVRKTLDRLAAIALGEVASSRLARQGIWLPGQDQTAPPQPQETAPLERRPSGLWLPGTPEPQKETPGPVNNS